jgi:hypothetical protein
VKLFLGDEELCRNILTCRNDDTGGLRSGGAIEGDFEAAEYIPPDRLGTTDDCGFAPFSDDTSRTRETAFDKIRARVAGTALASKVLGLE